MADLVIVVGLTGVGKTSAIDAARDRTDLDTEVISYGTELLETAQALDLVDHRDELTEMPPAEYDRLQAETAESIRETVTQTSADSVFLDTHAALSTPVGYRPGLTADDVDVLQPDQLVQIRADPAELQLRREADESRDRTVPSVQKLAEQQEVAGQMASACSVLSRAPLVIIDNPDGELDMAAGELVTVLET